MAIPSSTVYTLSSKRVNSILSFLLKMDDDGEKVLTNLSWAIPNKFRITSYNVCYTKLLRVTYGVIEKSKFATKRNP